VLKSFNNIKINFYAGMQKSQKKWFVFFNLFVSAYITFVIYISQSDTLFARRDKTIIVVLGSILIFLLIYNAIILICSKYNSRSIIISEKKSTIKKGTIVLFSGLLLVILLLALIASFPGGKSPDTNNQWKQVHSFNFNDWHPVIHTLLIWLITRIIDHYAFVIFIQISVFSIGVGYLIATLESWGFNKKCLLVIGLLIILNPYTMNMMMYPWKDLALTILLTYITIMTINIYYSHGLWFLKWRNVFLFALITGLASCIRHNGFFFTVPLYIVLIMQYSKRNVKIFIAIALSVLTTFFIKGPLYTTLKVENPNNTYRESVGIPMTILGDTLIKNPKLLPPEAREFLNTIATDEYWRENYVPGDYNSIKFKTNASDIIETIPPKTFMKWVIKTCLDANYEAFHAFCDVTNIVWKINDDNKIIKPILSEKNNLLTKALHICFLGYSGICLALPIISSLFTNLGLHMLILLLIGILSLSKNGVNVLLFVIPSVLYNLGTMLLLCGDDIRFFHFNFVITFPLIFVLLTKPNRQETICQLENSTG
jgi:hypothetical protein